MRSGRKAPTQTAFPPAHLAVTPDDGVTYDPPITVEVWGDAGDVTCVDCFGNAITYPMERGDVVGCQVSKVMATGTDATGIIGYASAPPVSNGLAANLANFWALDEVSGDRVNTERELPLVETDGSVGTNAGLRDGMLAAKLLQLGPGNLFSGATDTAFTGLPFTISFWTNALVAPVSGNDPNGFNYTVSVVDNDIGIFAEAEFVNNYDYAPAGAYVRQQCSVDSNNVFGLFEPTGKDLVWASFVGLWHHIVFGHDGANWFCQVDNGPRQTTAVDAFPAKAAYFAIGDWYSSGMYNPTAAFQFLAHWDDRALSEADVALLFNGRNGRSRAEMT